MNLDQIEDIKELKALKSKIEKRLKVTPLNRKSETIYTLSFNQR